MDGRHSLEEIARGLAERFPEVFPTLPDLIQPSHHRLEMLEGRLVASPQDYSRQRPTLPRRYQRSTIGPGGLNCRVRNGNGCNPSGITAGNAVMKR